MSRAEARLREIDERLFNPAAWFVIDARNQAVKGVAAPTLDAALDLLGKGTVAAVVGRLRPGALAVDVDVPGDFGHLVVDQIVGWLSARGWWTLVRPSGGCDGRSHVFTARADLNELDELRTFVSVLASELRLSRGQVDVRDAIRPLSSPHRLGTHTKPRGDLRESSRALKRVFPTLPQAKVVRRRATANARVAGHKTIEAHRPNDLARMSAHGVLAPHWRRYLNTGLAPSEDPGVRAGDRSLVEAGLTIALVRAGLDVDASWKAIGAAHPKAMTKARHQGRSWWIKYVWNRAVDDYNNHSPSPRRGTSSVPSAAVRVAVAVARERLEDLKWSASPRARASLLLVGHHLLDRMARTGRLRVPCPERDLVLDTGITDRKTIRGVLRQLDGVLGVLHRDCLSSVERETTSFEFEILPPDQVGVRVVPPPRSHPPLAPRGLWATLPRSSHSLWRTLLRAPEGLDLPALCREAGLPAARTAEPTSSQLCTAREGCRALALAGLVQVDETGVWRASVGTPVDQVEDAASEWLASVGSAIEVEREEYRKGARSSWALERARAVKDQRERERRWWASLDEDERRRRRDVYRSRFATLSFTEQAAVKAKLAEGRITVGESELERYKAWLVELDPDEFVERSLTRKAGFRELSSNQRGLAVATWDQHRRRYGLTEQRGLICRDRDDHVVHAEHELLPHGTSERDSRFLAGESPHGTQLELTS